MTNHADGTLLFMERLHRPFQNGQENTLLVNVRSCLAAILRDDCTRY